MIRLVTNTTGRSAADDWDVATDATPEQVRALFRRVIPTGIRYGTVTVHFGRHSIEVTTFRIEANYVDGRHPTTISFHPDIGEDLRRRDLTINAMAYDLIGHRFLDPYGGLADIGRRTIRAVGEPDRRFEEDGLRIMRAIRFACLLEYEIEPGTRDAIVRNAERLQPVAPERIRNELMAILNADFPSIGLRLLRDYGMLQIISPELAACVGFRQEKPVETDLFEHLIGACDRAPRHIRLAALLHDIAKPITLTHGANGTISFPKHEIHSEQMARRLLRRLRFPNTIVDSVSILIRHHGLRYEPGWSDGTVRRWLTKLGADAFRDLLALQYADICNKSPQAANDPVIEEFRLRVEKIVAATGVLTRRELAINGHDLQRELAIPPGPRMGRLLDFLLESVLDDPEQNSHPLLLEMARRFWNSRIGDGE